MTAYMDQCTRVYTRTGLSAHLLRPQHSPNSCMDEALCGLLPDADGWRGTGTQDEHDGAATMPLCRHCVKAAPAASAAAGLARIRRPAVCRGKECRQDAGTGADHTERGSRATQRLHPETAGRPVMLGRAMERALLYVEGRPGVLCALVRAHVKTFYTSAAVDRALVRAAATGLVESQAFPDGQRLWITRTGLDLLHSIGGTS